MTRFQALLITASFSAPVVVGLFLLVVNYFDNSAAAKQVKQKQADATRQTAGSALALSELSEAEREQLKLHIETLEVFEGRQERKRRGGRKLAACAYDGRRSTYP